MKNKIKQHAITVYAILGIAFMIRSGFIDTGYPRRSVDESLLARPYPFEGVFCFIVILLVEAAITYAILQPKSYHRSFGRAFAASLFISLPFTFYLFFSMHQTSFYIAHLIWLTVGIALLLLLLVVSSASAVFYKFKR